MSSFPRTLVALPVFNEATHVVDVLSTVKNYCSDILVVDDGSTDETYAVLKTVPGIKIVQHTENQGYGAALRTAFEYAISEDYDILVTIDCDGQHEPRLIPELAAQVFPEADERCDIVSGSRYLKSFSDDSIPPQDRQRINLAITDILNARLNLNLTDAFCGFKAYRVDALREIEITEFGYAMPMQFWPRAVAAGMKIVEFPVPLVYLEEERSFGGSLDIADTRMAYYMEVLERELQQLCETRVEKSSTTMGDCKQR